MDKPTKTRSFVVKPFKLCADFCVEKWKKTKKYSQNSLYGKLKPILIQNKNLLDSQKIKHLLQANTLFSKWFTYMYLD